MPPWARKIMGRPKTSNTYFEEIPRPGLRSRLNGLNPETSRPRGGPKCPQIRTSYAKPGKPIAMSIRSPHPIGTRPATKGGHTSRPICFVWRFFSGLIDENPNLGRLFRLVSRQFRAPLKNLGKILFVDENDENGGKPLNRILVISAVSQKQSAHANGPSRLGWRAADFLMAHDMDGPICWR